jgi:nicotinamide mononucleotide adenylyltransferase
MSQPYTKDPLTLDTFSQPETQDFTLETVGRITESERDAKIRMFNENIDRYRQDFVNENTAKQEAFRQVASEDADIQDNTYEIERKGKYYYFIGRLNPPHEGHIEALLNVISNAIDNGGIAIILLGSGPNGGERTSKDPLNFEIKRNFVIDKLKDKLKYKYPGLDIDEMFENGRIQISEMGKTTEQIRSVIQNDIGNQLFEELEAIRISGDKDGGEDLKKLAWIEKALSAGIIGKDGNIIPLTARVIAQPAVQSESKGEPMSATIIRKIVYDMDPFTNYENRLQAFKDNTHGFYETRALDHTKSIFDAIDMYHPGKVISGSDKKAIKSKPTVVKPKIKSKKGGSKRRKLRKTKCKLSKRSKLYKRSKLTKRHNLIKRKSRRR